MFVLGPAGLAASRRVATLAPSVRWSVEHFIASFQVRKALAIAVNAGAPVGGLP